MKMMFNSWNNQRRKNSYWISVMLLIFLASHLIIGMMALMNIKIQNTGRDMYFGFYILTGITIGIVASLFLGTLMVLCINKAAAKHASDIFVIHSLCGTRYRIIHKYGFMTDVLIGIILECLATCGFVFFQIILRSTFFLIFYSVFLLSGSILYWHSVFPVREYHKISGILNDPLKYPSSVRFTISNGGSISSFCRLPNRKILSPFCVDETDLELLRKKEGLHIDKRYFYHFVIMIDTGVPITSEFIEKAEEIMSIPHGGVLICVTGKNRNSSVDSFLRNTSKSINVQIVYDELITSYDDPRISVLLKEYIPGKAEEKQNPYFISDNSIIHDTYSAISTGSLMCCDFWKVVFHELDLLPSIYALFDIIDLQYRMRIAFAISPDLKWLYKKSMVIGNIGIMAKILKGKHNQYGADDYHSSLTTRMVFDEILTEMDKSIIMKYLPRYRVKYDETGQMTVTYLSSALRNVLRGHGTFSQSDASYVFNLIFKLAMLNSYILSSNTLIYKTDSRQITDNSYRCVYDSFSGKLLYPFLIADEDDVIYVFNRFIRKNHDDHDLISVEYINYLNGQSVIPSFHTIEIKKN